MSDVNALTPENKRFFGLKKGDSAKQYYSVICKLCYTTACYKTQTTTNFNPHVKRNHPEDLENSTKKKA